MHRVVVTFAAAAAATVFGCDVAEPDDGIGGDSGSGGQDTAQQEESGSSDGADALDDMQDEPCAGSFRAARMCPLDSGAGTQFCGIRPGASGGDAVSPYVWGACLAAVVCTPDSSNAQCDDGATATCELDVDAEPIWVECEQDMGGTTPLVLSFGDAPVQFEPMPASAGFDIDGDGRCLSHDWPTPDTPWLAADLDGNGAIDGGHELFGSGSMLDDGTKATDGFMALAEFDSNADGEVSELDVRWAELVVWSDLDRDKRTDAGELEPLSSFGVTTLPLAYERVPNCDDRRNCGLERASFMFTAAQSQRVGRVIDVHLPCPR